jgi:hypothetical protein
MSLKLAAFAEDRMARPDRLKCRSFDSAEVRFAEDDRPFFDMNFGNRTPERKQGKAGGKCEL